MNAQLRMQDKIDEAKQHLEVLEELRDEVSFLYEKYGKDKGYDETKALINALDFAIDFIKWGMKN